MKAPADTPAVQALHPYGPVLPKINSKKQEGRNSKGNRQQGSGDGLAIGHQGAQPRLPDPHLPQELGAGLSESRTEPEPRPLPRAEADEKREHFFLPSRSERVQDLSCAQRVLPPASLFAPGSALMVCIRHSPSQCGLEWTRASPHRFASSGTALAPAPTRHKIVECWQGDAEKWCRYCTLAAAQPSPYRIARGDDWRGALGM